MIRFNYVVLICASLLYLVFLEKPTLGMLVFYPVGVFLPWYWINRTGLLGLGHHTQWVSLNVFAWLNYLAIFVKEFFLANVSVVKIIWSPRKAPAAKWIEVESACRTNLGQLLIANFISMTPGTISWEVKTSQGGTAHIGVHCLDGRSAASVQKLVKRLDPLVRSLTEPSREKTL